jgi:methylated-DNA-[protein]-cysteine S-methyltransferase
MKLAHCPLQVVAFDSDLGWMAAIGAGLVLKQLTFGHRSQREALRALDSALLASACRALWCEDLVGRLRAYAAGARVDFRDVRIDLDSATPFKARVIECCRAIAPGQTRSYGQLAAAAGSPGAARAVGNVMAGNRFPLIVPCHRVVHSDHRLGSFSAPEGTRMKARLLRLEQAVRPAAARQRELA